MCVCFKVETHNHPSAIEPYGGAETGIGGVIRDPLGTGLGAKPIANTDVFCFAPPDMPDRAVPEGCLQPKRVMKGVVAGVRDYGNRMGIPTVNGAIFFDERFVGNPLVYCGNVGLIPRDKVDKASLAGDLVVVVGGRTGRDGIHGATLSSAELETGSETTLERRRPDRQPHHRKEDDRRAPQGARPRPLQRHHRLRRGRPFLRRRRDGRGNRRRGPPRARPAQVPGPRRPGDLDQRGAGAHGPRGAAGKLEALVALFASENVEATAIGTFTGDRRLRLYYEGTRWRTSPWSSSTTACRA